MKIFWEHRCRIIACDRSVFLNAFGVWARFSLRARKAIAKSLTLSLQSRLIHTETDTETDELKMALRARKISGASEKRVPGCCSVE